MRHRQRWGWVVLGENLFIDDDFARLSVRERLAYVDGLAASAAAGEAREIDGPGEYTGCGVVMRQRRVWSTKIRSEIYDRDGNACLYCGAGEPLELDHVVPLARGGSDVVTNLQTLCRPCNRKKSCHA